MARYLIYNPLSPSSSNISHLVSLLPINVAGLSFRTSTTRRFPSRQLQQWHQEMAQLLWHVIATPYQMIQIYYAGVETNHTASSPIPSCSVVVQPDLVNHSLRRACLQDDVVRSLRSPATPLCRNHRASVA